MSHTKKSQKKKDVREVDNPDTDIMVPYDIEHDFVKAKPCILCCS